MPERVMFTMGDIACAEGALSAGCRYFGGYPITPATEIAEWMSQRMPELGGAYVQYEDVVFYFILNISSYFNRVTAVILVFMITINPCFLEP